MNSKKIQNYEESHPLVLTENEILGLQNKSLEILKYFKEFCQQHKLNFCLCGGCCIGAIRHKGFIPWDDDVDVFMPRKDYEKLPELWEKYADTEKYSCNRTTKEKFMGNIMTTITDNKTTVIRPWQKKTDGNKGVMMDILPLDGCAPKGIKRKLQMMWSMIFSLYCSKMVPKNHGKLVSIVGRFMLKMIPSNNLKYKIWKFAEKQMTKYSVEDSEYIVELCSGPHYMKNEYSKETFSSVVHKNFQGYLMPLPVGYDSYLKTAFGDYMKLPPPEGRVPHHDIIFLDLGEI